jgi:hypothetical protein
MMVGLGKPWYQHTLSDGVTVDEAQRGDYYVVGSGIQPQLNGVPAFMKQARDISFMGFGAAEEPLPFTLGQILGATVFLGLGVILGRMTSPHRREAERLAEHHLLRDRVQNMIAKAKEEKREARASAPRRLK